MFANTLTLTINAVAKVLTRVNQDNFGSFYKFADGVEAITMQIRHTTDTVKGGVSINRHNVYVERTVFATPTTTEKYWSMTATLRDRVGSDPTVLLQSWVGFSTLLATLDDGLVVGEN
uniref:Uncharacterized protein n=1 Tax=Leviviridae sp. TaxID=2027243 RepID=A0A514DC82_9VIRU|nr:MAG: hypothetical protein H2Bulk341670_000002 [Leviviridae sp.]